MKIYVEVAVFEIRLSIIARAGQADRFQYVSVKHAPDMPIVNSSKSPAEDITAG